MNKTCITEYQYFSLHKILLCAVLTAYASPSLSLASFSFSPDFFSLSCICVYLMSIVQMIFLVLVVVVLQPMPSYIYNFQGIQKKLLGELTLVMQQFVCCLHSYCFFCLSFIYSKSEHRRLIGSIVQPTKWEQKRIRMKKPQNEDYKIWECLCS